MRLQGKTAIITGAGSGIGEASARIFAAEGARVAVVDRDQEGGKRVAERDWSVEFLSQRRRHQRRRHGSHEPDRTGEVRPHRHSLQQCRGFVRGRAARNFRRGMGPGDGDQHQGHLSRQQIRRAHHAQTKVGLHHQHGFGRRQCWDWRSAPPTPRPKERSTR